MEKNSTVQVIERAGDILSQFSIEEPVLGITEIAKRTALNKGTVYRILLTLEQMGFVRRDDMTQKYRLGLALFRLGSLVQAGMDVRREALPVMHKLSEQCGETVNLNVIYENQRVCLECVETSHSIRNWVQIGMTAPLIRGASGKILLAYMSDADIAMNIKDMPAHEASVLRSQLNAIRDQGYAVTNGERASGSAAVSAPIFNCCGQTVASLTISGPSDRFSDSVINKNILLVKNAAREISQKLGYSVSSDSSR